MDRDNLQLFDPEIRKRFNFPRLEALAHREIKTSSLISRCAAGDIDAATALSKGFWPFTYAFEQAIDRRLVGLPREPLYERFGRTGTRRQLLSTSRTLTQLAKSERTGVFPQEEALREMQKDEWRHSKHWAADAENLGISGEDLDKAIILPGVQRLIDAASDDDIVACFARSYSATEFIAEALGEKLAHCKPYTNLFRRGRAVWMEVHTVPHDEGPSHEEIVMDFAAAYDDSGSPKRIETLVAEGIEAFGIAADEVEAHYAPTHAVAAE